MVNSRLNPWDRPMSVPKYLRTVPQAKYAPLPGLWVPPQSDPYVAPVLPHNGHADTTTLSQSAILQGYPPCVPLEADPENSSKRAPT